MWLYSEIKTLADIPRHYGAATPDALALVDAHGDALSFAALDRYTDQLANTLLDCGVGAGDRVAILGKNSVTVLTALFGAIKAGACLLPLNWRLAAPELTRILADAAPRILLADSDYSEFAHALVTSADIDCRVIEYDSRRSGRDELHDMVAGASARDPGVPIDPWQTAVLMYTSGTTGAPKGVQLSHQGFLYLRLCDHLHPAVDFDSDDVMLTVMPLFHAMGIALSLQTIYFGGAVVVAPMPDPGALIELVERRRPTLLPVVPSVLQMLLDHPDAATADYSSVRRVIYAGSPITTHLLQRAIDTIACDFINFYGATETSSGITMLTPQDHTCGDEGKLRSCGKPMPLVDIKVVDPNGATAPNGTVGEILIRSPSLATGYFKQPEATAAAFGSGWYRSGDAGYQDADGYLYIVDRVKDMIITGGENVYSLEVENALHTIFGVSQCAVIGLPDIKWGERVTAFVVTEPASGLTVQEIQLRCRELIAGYKVPKEVRFIDSLPLTPSGKVLKRALKDLATNQ
jgi:acyl-CoA synthetase (AMP-forming)/AMP-acid ligase II